MGMGAKVPAEESGPSGARVVGSYLTWVLGTKLGSSIRTVHAFRC